MNISEATQSYEDWMRHQIDVVEAQLRYKHRKIRQDLFSFFKGTFYRWIQLWDDVVPDEVREAPKILCVGDLHVESFGTWRDLEARLIWGIDDFDEAYRMPFTNDLVRLAASARIVRDLGQLKTGMRETCGIILEGYTRSLREGGSPIALAEREQLLEKLGVAEFKSPEQFWEKLKALPAYRKKLPAAARRAIERSLPDSAGYRVVTRIAGTGSLGHRRFVALADWKGGEIAREAKATVPSACVWLRGRGNKTDGCYDKMIDSAVRARDPFQQVIDGWLIRRLSPESNPIRISDWPKKRDELKLLQMMGRETANVHHGSGRQIESILRCLKKLDGNWLHHSSKKMAKAVEADWKEYIH